MPLHVSSTCAPRQEGKIVLYSLWYHHTYKCDDTRCCIIQLWPPDDEHMCSKHVHPSILLALQPWVSLRLLTTSLHCSLSSAFSVHCLIFIALKSATTSSIHLKRRLPFLLPVNGLPSIILLGIAPASILFTWPSHLMLCAFMNFTSSKHVEAWNKLIIKCSASSWLILINK